MSAAPIEYSVARPPETSGGRRDFRPLALAWALAASLVVHAGVIVATRPGSAVPGIASIAPRVIEAVLAPPQSIVEPPPPVVATEPNLAVATAAPTAIPAPRAPPPAKPVGEPIPTAKTSTHGLAALAVTAEPLLDKVRLGDYLTRQTSEFRTEIDRPVRLEDPIVANYPAAALREGREESVAVWVVVDHTGQADEVDVIDGSQEFAEAVVAAINAAKFLPAERNLRPIRFPIALEFRFRTSAGDGTAAAAAAAQGK